MKRFLTIALLIIVLIVVVTVPFIIWGGTKFASFSDQEKTITTFLLASLELIGLVVSTAIVIFILYQYIRYRRPYRLIFDAFSNELALIQNENKPLNLSVLAKEKLVRQFIIIFNELKVYSGEKSQDFEAFVADELYIEEDLSENDIEIYVSANQIIKSGIIEDTKGCLQDLN